MARSLLTAIDMMDDTDQTPRVYLNGRLAAGFEIPRVEHAIACERARELGLLAGVLTTAPVPRHEGRPVADLLLEFS